MALDFSALEAELTRTTDINGSAKLLMKRLFDEFEANKNSPAKIQELVDRGRASNDDLATAVIANTPAENPPPPPPA